MRWVNASEWAAALALAADDCGESERVRENRAAAEAVAAAGRVTLTSPCIRQMNKTLINNPILVAKQCGGNCVLWRWRLLMVCASETSSRRRPNGLCPPNNELGREFRERSEQTITGTRAPKRSGNTGWQPTMDIRRKHTAIWRLHHQNACKLDKLDCETQQKAYHPKVSLFVARFKLNIWLESSYRPQEC